MIYLHGRSVGKISGPSELNYMLLDPVTHYYHSLVSSRFFLYKYRCMFTWQRHRLSRALGDTKARVNAKSKQQIWNMNTALHFLLGKTISFINFAAQYIEPQTLLHSLMDYLVSQGTCRRGFHLYFTCWPMPNSSMLWRYCQSSTCTRPWRCLWGGSMTNTFSSYKDGTPKTSWLYIWYMSALPEMNFHTIVFFVGPICSTFMYTHSSLTSGNLVCLPFEDRSSSKVIGFSTSSSLNATVPSSKSNSLIAMKSLTLRTSSHFLPVGKSPFSLRNSFSLPIIHKEWELCDKPLQFIQHASCIQSLQFTPHSPLNPVTSSELGNTYRLLCIEN